MKPVAQWHDVHLRLMQALPVRTHTRDLGEMGVSYRSNYGRPMNYRRTSVSKCVSEIIIETYNSGRRSGKVGRMS